MSHPQSHFSSHSHGDSHGDEEIFPSSEHGQETEDLYGSSEEGISIESAGIINDLSEGFAETTIDLTGFFEFGTATAVDHNPGHIFNDIPSVTLLDTGNPQVEIDKQELETRRAAAIARMTLDFSKKRNLRIQTKRHGEFLDLYSDTEFVPTLIQSFTKRSVSPRFPTINLCPLLPEMRENTVDIRDVESILAKKTISGEFSDRFAGEGKTYPDLYLLPMTIARRSRLLRKRHARRLGRVALFCLATGGIVSIVLAGLGSLAKSDTLEAYQRLIRLKEIQNPTEISIEISNVKGLFDEAQIAFWPIHALVAGWIVENESVRNADHAILGGQSLLQVAQDTDRIRNFLVANLSAEIDKKDLVYLDPRIVTHSNAKITDYVRDNQRLFTDLRTSLAQAQFHYASITTTGDSHNDEELARVNGILSVADETVRYLSGHSEDIFKVLGDTKPMHYLVLNQNRDELRANGGFPGSAVEVVLYKWRIEKYEKKDIYFYDWHLFPYGEKPPAGIDQLTDVYGIRDANYYPNFNDSFATIGKMYEKAGGSTLDGLVAINQWLIEDLLAAIGPVTVPGIREPVTAENFSVLLSVLVEGQYARQDTAKDILFTTIAAIEKKTSSSNSVDLISDILKKQVNDGQILVSMRDNSLNAFTTAVFGAPKYLGNPWNFVYPVFTSLSGNKSDRYMDRTFTIRTEPAGKCTFHNTFEISNTHSLSVTEREKIRNLLYGYGIDPKQQEHELFVQGNGDNVEYVRILVPKGSVLLSNSSSSTYRWTGAAAAKLVSSPVFDDSNADYDMITSTVRTVVGNSTKITLDYLSTPKNCSAEADFIVQPWLRNFKLDRTPVIP